MADRHEITDSTERKLEELATQIADSRVEIAGLKSEIARLSGSPQNGRSDLVQHHESAAPIDPEGNTAPDGDGPLSRRGALLALGGVAAGGVGMALGSAFLGAEPAAAANPDLILDQSNSATATTSVTGGIAGAAAFEVSNTAAGTGLYGIATSASGLANAASLTGVIGDTGSDGEFGVIGACGSTDGSGVYGVAVGGSGITPGSAMGVFGETNAGHGVVGASSAGNGVYGFTSAGGGTSGVSGKDESPTAGQFGVSGTSAQGVGVYGSANANGQFGVLGTDSSPGGGYGVCGESVAGSGVHGVAAGASGVPLAGLAGIFGECSHGQGVAGISTNGNGVFGYTAGGGSGVEGYDATEGGSFGVFGDSVNGTGVFGGTNSSAGVGVKAVNLAGPSLLLQPFSTTTLPTTSSPGQFIVLADGSLWYSYLANEWVQLNNGIVTLPAPVRVIDTTSSGGSVGGIAGPLVPGAAVHTSSTLTGGATGIPAQALGLTGNFAISGVGGALLNGYGLATMYAAGVTPPATASLNSGAGCYATSNWVTVRLGTGGNVSIIWDGGGPVPRVDAFFDVTGYIL